MSNNFISFPTLPAELQKEAIREGELRLNAQFQAAGSADQRALTWSGFLIAAATASLGAGIALLTKATPDLSFAVLALCFSGAVLRSAWLAISTVLPASFDFPGNSPASWLPEEWAPTGTDAEKVSQARAQQAQHIAEAITDNRGYAEANGRIMRRSFKWALRSVFCGALVVTALIIGRNVQILEPTSEIVVVTKG